MIKIINKGWIKDARAFQDMSSEYFENIDRYIENKIVVDDDIFEKITKENLEFESEKDLLKYISKIS